jgi:S1-C subfamily serine protease
VVKIYSTVRYPSPYKPWTKEPPTEISGTGVVIEGKRILTCAHVVLYAGRIEVQGNEAADRISAKVQAIAPGIDLALLKLDDESFFDSHPALLQEQELPDIRDAVMAYGYPTGGSSLSITKGIVSRIEFAAYNYPVTGLRIQIDAAINPGNSGGPAVVGSKMVGLAFSYLNGSQNIGYIIPCEEIDLFLRNIVDGQYDGKPALFGECQALGNPTLRSFLKLDKSVEGVILHKPESADPNYPVKEWDVITRIGKTPIDNLGTVKLSDNLRVFFKYLVQKTARNGKVPLTIVRSGKELNVEVPVPSNRDLVIPSLDGLYPSYFIYGPVVFSAATTEFVGGLMAGNLGGNLMGILGVSGNPLVKRLGDTASFPGERLVVVSAPFFPHKLSQGYSNPACQVVKSINGIPVKSLGHLVQILRDSKDEFIVFEFESRNGQTLVFRRTDVLSATEDILTDNDLRTQGSPDMLAIWNAK